MSAVAGEALILSIGDGETEESFHALQAVTLNRFDITQQLVDHTAVAEHAWAAAAASTQRRLVIECEGLVYTQTAAARLRQLALSGLAGNILLQLAEGETIAMAAWVTAYQEVGDASEAKRFQCRLESSGAVTYEA